MLAAYQAAFNTTLTDVAGFAEKLARHAAREGFRCFVARDDPAGPILGFVYGYTGAPGQWWTDLVSQGLGPALAVRWLDRHFEFVEFGVIPAARGRGLGARLHDTILTGLSHRTAALSTQQEETVALAMYRRRGWQTLLRDFIFPNSSAPYVIMGLDLVEWRGR